MDLRREIQLGINSEWEKVNEFHKVFGHPAPLRPRFLDKDRAGKRYAWMLEELDEFMESETLTDQADAMIDLIYFALGTMVEMGVKPEGLFSIVHKANMDKLWDDGKPHCKEDGKIIKPDAWKDPGELLKAEIYGGNASCEGQSGAEA
jgi:predicted HAD superfamily Cof-like phosphohydrolase